MDREHNKEQKVTFCLLNSLVEPLDEVFRIVKAG